jgi:hypothetical protein
VIAKGIERARLPEERRASVSTRSISTPSVRSPIIFTPRSSAAWSGTRNREKSPAVITCSVPRSEVPRTRRLSSSAATTSSRRRSWTLDQSPTNGGRGTVLKGDQVRRGLDERRLAPLEEHLTRQRGAIQLSQGQGLMGHGPTS